MPDVVELWDRPQAERMVMLAGWRQWADAGSLSSGLPKYLVQRNSARRIGRFNNQGFYMFQIPGTHDLVRPVVRFENGYPRSMETRRNELFFTRSGECGVVIFLGDEPHLDIDRYSNALFDLATDLKVERIVSLGGVYGELPFDRERIVSCNFSLKRMADEFARLAVNLSDYHGGASIGSYLCSRASERDLEYAGMHALVPTYDFSNMGKLTNTIRIENDFTAWLGVMRRVNFMLRTSFALEDLEEKSKRLVEVVESKVDELEKMAPEAGVRDYLKRLSDEFEEPVFDPLDDVWEDALRGLLDDRENPA